MTHSQHRITLWCRTYTEAVHSGNAGCATEWADAAVREFDERFHEDGDEIAAAEWRDGHPVARVTVKQQRDDAVTALSQCRDALRDRGVVSQFQQDVLHAADMVLKQHGNISKETV